MDGHINEGQPLTFDHGYMSNILVRPTESGQAMERGYLGVGPRGCHPACVVQGCSVLRIWIVKISTSDPHENEDGHISWGQP